MKDDLISRQAAIDYCQALINAENPSDEWNYSQERINQTEVILDHLEVMPSAQPGWIQVTDRLPEMTDTYLVQVGINENGEGMHTEVRTADWNAIWQTWYVHTTRCFVGDIIKWMPIPWEGGQS